MDAVQIERAASLLGKASAEARRKKKGEKAFNESMQKLAIEREAKKKQAKISAQQK